MTGAYIYKKNMNVESILVELCLESYAGIGKKVKNLYEVQFLENRSTLHYLIE